MKNENTCCSGSRSLSGESAASAPPAQGPARPPWPCASLYLTIGKGLNLPFSSYGIFHRPYLQGDHVQQGLVRLVPKEQIEWIHNMASWCVKLTDMSVSNIWKSSQLVKVKAAWITESCHNIQGAIKFPNQTCCGWRFRGRLCQRRSPSTIGERLKPGGLKVATSDTVKD